MRRARTFASILAAALLLVIGPGSTTSTRSDELVADISEHLIAITTAFVGTTVVLFGTSDGEHDIAATVHGPRASQVVRRKSRVAGIWVNRDELAFANAPSFYAVASSRPLEQIARPDVRARHELGIDHLRLEPQDAQGRDIAEITTYRDALVRNKQRQGLYTENPGVIRFLGPRLFRTSIEFPANVQPGLYQVHVFELRDGEVTDAQRSTLVVSKVGFEADIYDFAQNRAPFYGLTAILISVTAGWLAGVIFRRG